MSTIRKKVALALGLSIAAASGTTQADEWDAPAKGKHVLLISIDGMHAVDFHNCAENGTCPNMAELAKTGVTYRQKTSSCGFILPHALQLALLELRSPTLSLYSRAGDTVDGLCLLVAI